MATAACANWLFIAMTMAKKPLNRQAVVKRFGSR
jgi:hypothetical protein